eukprot:2811830-Rhodomonas_salina.1
MAYAPTTATLCSYGSQSQVASTLRDAMPGTDLVYGAICLPMRCPVLTWRMVVCTIECGSAKLGSDGRLIIAEGREPVPADNAFCVVPVLTYNTCCFCPRGVVAVHARAADDRG